MYLQRLLRQQIIHALRASGLSAGMIGFQPTARREPNRELLRNRLRRVPVLGSHEDAATVPELVLVQDRRSSMSLLRNRPMVCTLLNEVPIQAMVDG